jgi:hypothetical protein
MAVRRRRVEGMFSASPTTFMTAVMPIAEDLGIVGVVAL